MDLMAPIRKELEAQEVIWGPDRQWWVGRINRSASAAQGMVLPESVTLVDATLREGEEVPGTFLTMDQKLKLARTSAALGFTELEVGYAGVIDEHKDLIRALKSEGLPVKIASHTRIYGQEDEWTREIDNNLACGADIMTMVGWASEVGCAGTPWLPKERVPERVRRCVAYAKSRGAYVTFGLADMVRTRPDWIDASYRAAAEEGADRLYIYDGQGAAAPHAVSYLTRLVRDIAGADVSLAFHGHNTFGLATANAIAAVTAGATVVDTVPLGLGEGAGITATEEIVMALAVLYGVETGIRKDGLLSYCHQVAEALGTRVPDTKAVVGKNTYAHSIDSHIAAIMRGAWDSWEVVRPDVVGQQRSFQFGFAKLRRGRSGALFAKAQQMGVEVTDAQLDLILDQVREVAKQSRFATEQDVEAIIRKVVGR